MKLPPNCSTNAHTANSLRRQPPLATNENEGLSINVAAVERDFTTRNEGLMRDEVRGTVRTASYR